MTYRSSCGTALAAAVALAACADVGPRADARISVTLQQSDAAVAAAAGWSGSMHDGAAVAGRVSRDTVAALAVRITDLQFLPATAEGTDDAAWVSLELSNPVRLDLLDLPSEGASPLVIASGTIAAGDYGKVRLFVDSAAIEFKGPINLGAAASFLAGIGYEVEIPSAAQTGLKTDIAFSVEEGADVNLLFAPNATFQNLTVTGNGRVILTPVIRSRPQ
jgi:hypothetical protein